MAFSNLAGKIMNATELKALQAPLKQQYKDTPETAIITLKANGRIGNK